MAAAGGWALLGLVLWLCAAAGAGELEGKRRAGPAKKKDIRDYNDADMARLLEQWEVRGGAGDPQWGCASRSPQQEPRGCSRRGERVAAGRGPGSGQPRRLLQRSGGRSARPRGGAAAVGRPEVWRPRAGRASRGLDGALGWDGLEGSPRPGGARVEGAACFPLKPLGS